MPMDGFLILSLWMMLPTYVEDPVIITLLLLIFLIPGNPVEVNRHLNSGRNLSVNGGYAYLAEGWDGFTILDINDPYNIVEVGDFPSKVQDVIVIGDYVVCITEGSVWLTDMEHSCPASTR